MPGDSAGGKEVGRISIRVVPNLDRFYEDLKAKLKEVEDSLKAEIKVVPKMDDFREKIKAETKGMTADVKVKPNIEKTDFAKALAEAKAGAKAAGLKLNVDIEDKGAQAHLAELLARLKLEAKAAHIKVDVDVERRTSKSGLASRAGSAFSGIGSGLGGAASALSDNTTLIAAAVFAVGAPALSLLSGLLAALPALITAVALPLGTLALGFKGIEGAAEAAGLLSVDSKGKKSAGAALKSLQDILSKKFQDGFTPIFQKIGAVLPAVGAGLLPIADRLIETAGALTDVVTSSAGMQALQTTVDGISNAMSVAIPGIKSFSSGLLALVAGGSKALPGLAGVFDQIGARFDSWVAKVNTPDFWGTSQLSRGLSAVWGVLSHLLNGIGDIAGKSFELLSDPKFVQNMETFVDELGKLITNSLPALKDFFNDIVGAIKDIDGLFARISQFKKPSWLDSPKDNPNASGGAGKPILLPEAGANLANALQFANIPALIIKNWSSIEPVLEGIWSNIVSTVSGIWDNFIGAVSWAGSSIWDAYTQGAANAWNGIVGIVSGVWDTITSTISNGISGLGSIWDTIVSGAQGAWNGLVSLVAQVWSQIVSAVSSAAGNIIAVVSQIPGQIAGIFAGAAGLLVEAGKNLIQGLINGITSMAGAAISAASGIASQIAGAVKGALGIHSPSTVFNEIGVNTMQGLQNGLEGGFQGVLDRAKSLTGQLSDAVKNGTNLSGFKDKVKQELKELDLERAQLKVQADAATDKGQKRALQDQMKQIGAVRDQLALQRDQLGFSKKQGDQQGDANKMQQQYGQLLNKSVGIGKNFADANIKQFESDIGISGKGAIPTIAEQGASWLTSTLGNLITNQFGGKPAQQGGDTHIHVNSVDEAMAAKQNVANKKALQYVGR